MIRIVNNFMAQQGEALYFAFEVFGVDKQVIPQGAA